MNARPALWIIALLACGSAAHAAPRASRAAAVPSPVQVTAKFYRWYVAKYRSDHDPMLELRAESGDGLSATLLDELDSQMAEAPPDRDYFLQVDDAVRPCHSLDARLLRAAADTAVVGVTLGSRNTPAWRVRVSLSREGDAWRIRDVARDPERPPVGLATRARSDC